MLSKSEGHPTISHGQEQRKREMTTEIITWSDEMGSRSRSAWLLLVKGEKIVSFTGQNLPSMVVVRGTDYHKNGKWSHTTYRLELATGVRAIPGKNGWETGRFVEGLRDATRGSTPIDTWVDVANALGVSVPSAMAFLREWRPKAAAALDEVDTQLSALDEAAGTEVVVDTETIVVSFGSPTNRQMAAGFWQNPKAIPGGGELRLLDTTKGWVKENIRVEGIVGTVLSATLASGHHGGYVSVTVAVVPGTTTPPPGPEEPSTEAAPPTAEPVAHATTADLLAKFGRR